MKIVKTAFFVTMAAIAGVVVGAGFAIYIHFSAQIPELDAAINYRPALITHIYDQNGVILAELAEEQRVPVSLSEISPLMISAVIATEDQSFYSHQGLDILGILRAAWINFRAGEVLQGGSTLTQQLAKSLFLTQERKLERKIKEAILAFRLEKELTKDRILELYLNQVYFGSGAYGVEAAARRYFSKSASELSLQESAMLAGLPKAPSRFSPLQNPDSALERRNLVLQRMAEKGSITREECEIARRLETGLNPDRSKPQRALYFIEVLRRELESEYGYDTLYRSGLDIHTTLRYEYQMIAEQAVRNTLFEVEKKRKNWKGPVEGIPDPMPPEEGVSALSVISEVTESNLTLICGGLPVTLPFRDIWIRNDDLRQLHPGDKVHFVVTEYTDSTRSVIKSGWIVQQPDPDAALISMDVHTGEVLAWVGGFDFWRSQFDRVTQSRRQPGSAFKPFIYAQALDSGYTASDVIYDTPIVVEKTWKTRAEINEELARKKSVAAGLINPDSIDTLNEIEFWKPQNYSEEFFGATTLREGLAKSRNVVSVHLLKELGPRNVIRLARKCGIRSHLEPTLSLALGSSDVSLMELTSAYSVFAGGGNRVEPMMIRRILDRDHNVIKESYPAMRSALRSDTAYLTTNLLSAVISEGTGFSANEIGYPLAGKTGTTNEYHDAWFIGYSPHLVTGVWVGVDLQEPIFPNATGASAALPIWKAFMQNALKDYAPIEFPVPKGVVFERVCRSSGKLATGSCQKVVREAFRVGTTPMTYCDMCEAEKKPGVRRSFTDSDWDYLEPPAETEGAAHSNPNE